MKTKLLLLVLLCGTLFASDTPTSGTLNSSTFVPISLPISEGSLTWTADIALMNGGKAFLTINGLPKEDPGVRVRGRYDEPHLVPPAKPEVVVIHLTTSDGKKWVARWEEVKP